MGHRQTRAYLVRDYGVWMAHVLGVVVDGAPNHIEFADDALVARTQRAIDALPPR